ncbi:glycosyltransferase family 2 protein [Inhella gelatinilytica]|uniref:Glycosyltransferase family 2 protein n=1 Tax=Inhella gelatinilytica TaxID=2795030 RepID=A0A931IYE3_9BURK|nr:glycosyltransferase family 2 protein [Inhella gelatinilytica]MBH9553886.1 glycosyltransferase family 2 protein [Inhella gelatinilytica]
MDGVEEPLVSILIPTHKRPDYLPLALESARRQTHVHLQIVISDNSGDDSSLNSIRDQLAADPRVEYHVQEGGGAWENWSNALRQARGTYVNFLMDDDLFHPTKVERMVRYFETFPTVGLVTSFRQLIDAAGNELPPLPGTTRLFDRDMVVIGQSMGDFILRHGMNLIGEPTTAMYRRSDLGAGFGRFCGRQYEIMTDLSTWMELMHGRHCVYISEPLSSFRIHGGQDQRKKTTAIKANMEWLQLLMDGHKHGRYIVDPAEFRVMLAHKLGILVPYLTAQHADLQAGDYDIEEMLHQFRTAFRWLLQA